MAMNQECSKELSVSTGMDSEAVSELICDICIEENNQVEAVGYCVDCTDFLCDECLRAHRKNRMSRHHDLQNGAQMPRERCTMVKPLSDICTERCGLHPREVARYYCRTHKILGCSVCIVSNHRLCDGVDHIPDIAQNLQDSTEYRQFDTDLTSLETNANDIIIKSTSSIHMAEKCCSDVACSIKRLREDVVQSLDNTINGIVNQAERLKTEEIEKLKSVIVECREVLQEIQSIKTDMQTRQENNRLCHVFIQMIHSHEKLGRLFDIVNDAEANSKVKSYSFQPSAEILQIIKRPSSFGKLTIMSQAGTAQCPTVPGTYNCHAALMPAKVHSRSQHFHLKDIMSARPVGSISLDSGKDNNDGYVSGCTVLSDTAMVTTDWYKCLLNLIHLPTETVTAELKTSSKPWDITQVANDQVAVTLPESRKILIVTATDTLTLNQELEVDGRCRGIAFGNGNLVVSFENPAKLEIMDIHGSVKRTLERQANTVPMFKWPIYLAFSKDNQTIYVSDCNDDSVKSVSLSGTIKAVYRDNDLSGPKGIAVEQQSGHVFVCGQMSGNVHILQPNCTKIKIYTHDLTNPLSLSCGQRSNRLYVGLASKGIKVYQL